MGSTVSLGYADLVRSSRFPRDLRSLAFAGVIGQALAARRRPLIRGLSEASFQRLMKTCFPGLALRNGECPGVDRDAFDEFDDLAERCAIAAKTIGDHRSWRHHDLEGRAARATADLMIAMHATSRDDE